jgi:hypothetical protein
MTCAMALASNAEGQQVIGGCPVLPANNVWNTPVDTLPVLSNSGTMVNTIGANRGFHADFGAGMWAGGPIGIPFITVPGSQAKLPATFLYADESDRGPYAIPLNVPIEGGSSSTGDRHAIALDVDHCILYELYRAFPQASSWTADSGVVADLKSNALRPSGWTSADAAGLPILPGLITYEEVQSGEIKHAIRFTVPQSRREFVWPARHFASSLTGTQYPRMGERFRLKASVNISAYPSDVQVILRAMKKYGIILADNGSAWYISGAPDPRWNDDHLQTFSQLLGSNFEAVDATVLRIDPNSGAAIQSGVSVAVTPSTASVRTGHFQSFSAAVTGTSTGVTWSVNDTVGGDPVVGTIDSSGQYLPPSTVPVPSVVTIRATSVAVPTASGAASVTILAPPKITSIAPSTLSTGNFNLTVTGVGFVVGSAISFDGSPLATTFVSATSLTATGNAPAARTSVPIAVKTPDGDVSNTVYVNITAPTAVSVAISPASATVRIRQLSQFHATVSGTTNTATKWMVNGIVGGSAAVGTISQWGLYWAPSAVPASGVVTVSAAAVADQTKIATASVTISKK